MMNGPPSREEFDAKLETARMTSEVFFARMDARCERMEAAFAAHRAEIAAQFDIRFAQMALELREYLDVRLRALHRSMIITAITCTLTTILGVGAINATVFTGMLSALSHGKELGALMTSMQQQNAELQKMLLQQKKDLALLNEKLDAGIDERREARRQGKPAAGRAEQRQ